MPRGILDKFPARKGVEVQSIKGVKVRAGFLMWESLFNKKIGRGTL
jgi:hypothetical protein